MSEQSQVTNLQTIINHVTKLLKDGQPAEALALLESSLKSEPQSAPLLHLIAQVKNRLGDISGALDYLNKAIDVLPEHVVLQTDRLYVLERLRHREALRQALEQAEQLEPSNRKYQQQLARFYTQLDKPERALSIIKRLRKQHADDTVLMFDEALNTWFSGEVKAAEKITESVCASEQAPSMAFYVRSLLRKQTKARNHVDDVAARARKTEVADTPLWFALAKEYDDLGLHELAVNAADVGNALQKKITPYNEAAELEALKQIRLVANSWKGQGRGNKKTDVTPVFIVGMPNTGATLVERMLSVSPQVKSLGEFADFPLLLNQAIERYLAENSTATREQAITELNYTELGKAYLAQISEVADGHSFVIDKLPFNFLYCGIIQKALPTAKIIHVSRDSLDTCWSIYRSLYAGRYAYAYNQAELGRYYRHYQDIMEAWHHALGEQLLNVSYEQLVANTEATQAQLSSFCGLPIESDEKAMVNQVPSVSTARGEPMITKVYKHAVGRAKPYADYLQDLVQALND